jgi:hypothetical protein
MTRSSEPLCEFMVHHLLRRGEVDFGFILQNYSVNENFYVQAPAWRMFQSEILELSRDGVLKIILLSFPNLCNVETAILLRYNSSQTVNIPFVLTNFI